ncbi:MAG: MOSC domain-containing protein [Candidatus Microthrix parvicella]|nr:MOSC domain-containing protein [Candidatus Microthrix parvicella]
MSENTNEHIDGVTNQTDGTVGTVARCFRAPVKSMQGLWVDSLEFGESAAVGDRAWGLIDDTTGKLMTAKRYGRLLEAGADDTTITLADGRRIEIDSPTASGALSEWLGRAVTLCRAGEGPDTGYEMTFDPPNDDAEYYEIPTPPGTFLDLAAAHLMSSATLAACAEARGDLNWDVRRFRPNLLIDVADGVGPFGEEAWVGRNLHVGTAVLSVQSPTVRCAMPLRAQPAEGAEPDLQRQRGMFAAMNELNGTHPNHLGIYLQVVRPGTVAVGDPIKLED